MTYFNAHKGGVVLLVGNGLNLYKTPPELFSGYPSFGMNTIYRYEGWMPTYYTAVDFRVYYEFGKEINKKYAHIPKFIPTPNLDRWQGDNFIRFVHRPGEIKPTDYPDALRDGIAFSNIMTVAMQLAWFMGFTTMLLIGVEHNPNDIRRHFWGDDLDTVPDQPLEDWLNAYRVLMNMMKGIRVLNLSPDTYVPADILPRGDWREWSTNAN